MATVVLEPGAREASRRIIEAIYDLVKAKDPTAMSRRIKTGGINLTITAGDITDVEITQSAVDPF